MPESRYDAVAVDLTTNKVRIMERNLDGPNVDAFCNMAVMRRGVQDEFFAPTTAGKYNEGDDWQGRGFEGLVEEDPRSNDRIVVVGNMAFPRGPRGLGSSRDYDDD